MLPSSAGVCLGPADALFCTTGSFTHGEGMRLFNRTCMRMAGSVGRPFFIIYGGTAVGMLKAGFGMRSRRSSSRFRIVLCRKYISMRSSFGGGRMRMLVTPNSVVGVSGGANRVSRVGVSAVTGPKRSHGFCFVSGGLRSVAGRLRHRFRGGVMVAGPGLGSVGCSTVFTGSRAVRRVLGYLGTSRRVGVVCRSGAVVRVQWRGFDFR